MKTWIYIVAYCLPLFFNFEASQSSFNKIEHQIYVKHPGEKAEVPTILTEVQNQVGLPISYYADVESVICLEQVCKVIPVRLFWNNIGEYQKYELAKGKTLEKYEADLFEPQDYVKIHDIMSNPNSPFKDVYIDEILTVSHEIDEDEVDAVSGATALALDEKDTVPGAALTCYTLWHWANGDIVSKIKQQTGASVSEEELQRFALHENNAYFQIALNEFQRRSLYAKVIIDLILQKVFLDKSLIRMTMEFFDNTPSETYFYTMERLIEDGEKQQKLAAIQSLSRTSFDIKGTYLDELSSQIDTLKSYQEISNFLNLLEAKNYKSKNVVNNVMPLLDADFLISRRAYWFLSNAKISSSQKQYYNSFYEKNKDRL